MILNVVKFLIRSFCLIAMFNRQLNFKLNLPFALSNAFLFKIKHVTGYAPKFVGFLLTYRSESLAQIVKYNDEVG